MAEKSSNIMNEMFDTFISTYRIISADVKPSQGTITKEKDSKPSEAKETASTAMSESKKAPTKEEKSKEDTKTDETKMRFKNWIDKYFNKRKDPRYHNKKLDYDFVIPKDQPAHSNKKNEVLFYMDMEEGLLRFFQKHGITKFLSHQVGFSEKEQKYYGWSHRAIYGFGVGEKIKKGGISYEERGAKHPYTIKTLEQAKEEAKLFAKGVS